jgi:hypothetical protein
MMNWKAKILLHKETSRFALSRKNLAKRGLVSSYIIAESRIKSRIKSIMKEEMNLKMRTTILEYSLQIENSVNTLLVGYLEIFEKEKTKNFGTKAGIPFQSKIDLLLDIGVLEPAELKEIELLMIFRNKFLHDIDSNSFIVVLDKIDSGIKNRLLKFLEPNINKENATEKDYEDAFRNLFIHNLKTLSKKYKKRRENIINKTNYMTSLYDAYISMNELSTNFAQEILQIAEKSNIENPLISSAFEPIMKSCLKFVDNYNLESEKIEKLEKIYELLPKKKMII